MLNQNRPDFDLLELQQIAELLNAVPQPGCAERS
jgi:hypothetical protein